MKPTSRFSSLAAALLVAVLAGCKADTITEPRQPQAPPTPPGLGIVVSVSSSATNVAAGSTTPTTITVRATRQDGVPLSGQLTLTTSLGGFGSVGGPQSIVVDIVNGVGTAFFFPGAVAGVASIRVVDNGVILASTNVTIGEVSFVLSHLDPNSGSSAGGDTVDIVGSGFEAPATVLIGGSPAQVLSVSSTRIRVRTPPFIGDPGPNGTPVDVSVTIRAGASNSATANLANGFFYTRGSGGGFIPSIASVTPVNGPNEGGTLVTINGGGFQSPVQVLFEEGGVGVEAQVQSVATGRITVLSPSATGFGSVLRDQQVDIRVRNLSTGLEAVLANAFRYGVVIRITSISPNTGPATGGTLVTIFGEGFDEPVAVTFGTTAQQVVSVTGTEIVVRTVAVPVTGCGAAAGGGAVTVTNIETSASATGPVFNSPGPPEPLITRVQPSSGPAAGGTVVTITGTNFDPPVRVTFGEQAGNVTATSPTSITVTTPVFAGTFDSVACDDSPGDGQAGTRQVPRAVDVTVENLDTNCTDTLVGAFSFLPPDATCVGDEPPPPDPPVAAFTGICNPANFSCSFADTSTGNTSRTWNFGDPASGGNNTSASATPSHTFTTPNQGYLVTLTATNAGGSDTETHTVQCDGAGCTFVP